MKNSKILTSVILASAGVMLVAPLAVNAEAGVSDASVSIKEGGTPGPSGAISFVDVTANAKISFADTTLTGALLTAAEKTPGAAKIKLSDTRENLGAGKEGKYTVQVKDVTPTTTANGFLKNGLSLKLASANVSGTHTHNSPIVSTSSQLVFSGKYEAAVKEKAVTLNPTLTIPATLKTSGEYSAKLEWTLTPEI